MHSSPQAGYLYLINEAPVPKGGPASLNVLFPSPAAHGSALLSAGERVPIPSARDFFVFDDQQGEEKLWIVWASGPVAELEAVKKWVNPRDRGTIKDHHEAAAITDFLARHSTPNMEVIRDPSSRESVLHGRDDILVRLIKLEHH